MALLWKEWAVLSSKASNIHPFLFGLRLAPRDAFLAQNMRELMHQYLMFSGNLWGFGSRGGLEQRESLDFFSPISIYIYNYIYKDLSQNVSTCHYLGYLRLDYGLSRLLTVRLMMLAMWSFHVFSVSVEIQELRANSRNLSGTAT